MTIRSQELIRLVIFVVLAMVAAKYLAQLKPQLHCPTDEWRYNHLLAVAKTDPGRLFRLTPTENIRKPLKENDPEHEMFVAGPKIALVGVGYLFHTFLAPFGVDLLDTWKVMNLVLIFFQAGLFWMLFMPARKDASPNDAVVFATNKGLFLLFFVTLMPIYGQFLFFRTYNPLFGTLTLVLIWLWKDSRPWSPVFGGLVAGAMLMVSPAAPLVTALYFLGLLFNKNRWQRIAKSVFAFVLLFVVVEGVYRFHGGSFFALFYRHIFNNIHQNQIGSPFPYVPLTPLRYLGSFALPLLAALCLALPSIFKKRSEHPLAFALLCASGLWLVAFEIAPTVPLGRTMYALWIFLLVIVALVIPRTKKASPRWRLAFGLFIVVNMMGYHRPLNKFCAFEQDGPLLLMFKDTKKYARVIERKDRYANPRRQF